MAATRMGLNNYQAKRITRLAATHDRLAEAECNGDWPCDNGERKVLTCSRCGAGYVRAAMRQTKTRHTGDGCFVVQFVCQSCRTEDLISTACRENGIGVEFQGDPRGWTVKLVPLPVAATS